VGGMVMFIRGIWENLVHDLGLEFNQLIVQDMVS